jgi:very-short-patch-repair endonuclease
MPDKSKMLNGASLRSQFPPPSPFTSMAEQLRIQAARRNAPKNAPKIVPIVDVPHAPPSPGRARPRTPKSKPTKAPKPAEVKSTKARKGESKIEKEFLERWTSRYPDLKLQREMRFHPVRKWRFDFGSVEAKVAIEIEGGIWVNGAHNRGEHFESDAVKYNTAQSSEFGWIVFRLTPALLRDEPTLLMIAKTIMDRLSN